MDREAVKQALIAARNRIREYNKRQKSHSLLGRGTHVDNKTDAEILDKIEKALQELETGSRKVR